MTFQSVKVEYPVPKKGFLMFTTVWNAPSGEIVIGAPTADLLYEACMRVGKSTGAP